MKNNLFLLFALVFFSCTSNLSEKKYNALKSFVTENNRHIEDFDHVLRISETGCPGCNKTFARLVEKYIQSKKNLYIVSARGALIDISPYLEAEQAPNIILDFNNKFGKTQVIENSGMIFLKNNKIDTIVDVKAKGIEETLEYINSRLE